MIGQLESASVREDQNKAECGKQEMTVSKFSKKQSKAKLEEIKQIGEKRMSQFIDPTKVPKRRLYTGEEIPCIGMGTFGSDRFSAEEISNAVYGAGPVRLPAV